MLSGLGRAASRAAIGLLAAVFGIVVLLLAGAGALAWRLSDSPLDVTWLVPRLAPAFAPGWTAGHVTVQIVPAPGGHDLRLDVSGLEHGAAPTQSVGHATAGLALAPLLRGHLAASDVTLDAMRLHLASPSADPATARDGEASPAFDPERLLGRLRHLSITDSQVEVGSGMPGETVTVTGLAADVTRGDDGVLHGHADATAASGGAAVRAAIQGSYGPAGGAVQASIPSLNPAVLARAVPALAAGAALDADIALQAEASFGPGLRLLHGSLHADSGPGAMQLPRQGGASTARFASLTLDADATLAQLTLRGLKLVLAPPSGNPASTIVVSGVADRAGGRFTARMAVGIDRVLFADLGSLWPEGVGGGARPWLTENLTAGTARDGHVTFTLTGAETGGDLDLTEAGGTLLGDNMTLWWLRPVPPVQHAHALVTWQSPDALQVALSGGRQGAVEARTGTVRITGLTGNDQVAFIDVDLGGPLADVIAVLKQPRLQLLSKHPLPLTAPTGTVAAHLSVRLPLDADVTIGQVAIHAAGQVANTHLGGIAAGRDLDRGQLAFDVTDAGLAIDGTAEIARIPTRLAVRMDFEAGPRTQVLEHVTASLRLTKADAEKAGLGAIGLDGGSLAASVDYAERRDGTATVQLGADLKAAKFVTPLGWSKAAGTPGQAEARALLDHGRLVGLDRLRAEAPGLSVVARTDIVNGLPSVVHLERGEIGRSSATGDIVLPRREGEPYRITLAGPRLDLEGQMKAANALAAPDKAAPARPGPPYVVDLRFERVALSPDHGVGPVTLTASGAGSNLASAHLQIGGRDRAQADLVPAGAGRRLTATAQDLGALLRDTGLATDVVGGDLAVNGNFDDHRAGSPLHGTVDLRAFKVRGAPVAGKVLQALTVYGVVDALNGPGLVFERFETPFQLHGPVLTVENARAYSSSLGFTATGQLDLGRRTVDLKGTIVPAYFFNSLLGRIPLVGRLFSPEKGSGVFAADYGLRGPLADPSFSINPLSVLTPGITRRVFDLFK